MKETIKMALANVDFSRRYIDICNQFADFDNRSRFKKADFQEILKRINACLNYSSRESFFLKDYGLGKVTARIIIPYKSGIIDCTYAIWTEGFRERVNESFFDIALMQDIAIELKVQSYKFPIATSKDELEIILTYIIQLHNDFIVEFSKLLKSN